MTEANPPLFEFKTKPWAHQLEAFERFKDAQYCGLLFEQRVGKTLTSLIIAAHKFKKGEIDSLLIIAPSGVHRNWISDEIPTHFPLPYRAVLWQSSKMGSARARKDLEELLIYTGGLRILAVNVDALITKNLRDYLTKFFFRKKILTVIDESSDCSNPAAARTKMALKIGRRSKARMILDGTPVASSGPLGLYSQCDFLSPGALGFTSFTAFRARYAELEGRDVGERDKLCPLCFNSGAAPPCTRCNGAGFIGHHQIQVVKKFLNVEELHDKLMTFSMRVLRSDCHDLPEKIYQKLYVELTPDARRIYDELRAKFITELKSGTIVTAAMVLVRYLRLQQISSGFLPVEQILMTCPACQGADENCVACDGLGVMEDATVKPIEEISKINARLEVFKEAVVKLNGQIIIWCRFTHDVDLVLGVAKAMGKIAVRYDGQTSQDERATGLKLFQEREADWFVGSAKAGGRGIRLDMADTVINFSHDWSLKTRLQSEDRAQSLSKNNSVLYLDLIAVDTIDVKIIEALRSGKNIANLITGDKISDWI